MKHGRRFDIAGIAGSRNRGTGTFRAFRMEEIAARSRGQCEKKEGNKRVRGKSAPQSSQNIFLTSFHKKLIDRHRTGN